MSTKGNTAGRGAQQPPRGPPGGLTKSNPPSYAAAASAAPATAAPSASSAINTINAALQTVGRTEECNHRNSFRTLTVALTGREVTVELVDGSVIEGVLHAATLYRGQKQELAVKGCKLVTPPTNPSEQEIKPGSTVIIKYEHVVSFSGKPADLYPRKAASSEFKTDSATGFGNKKQSLQHLNGRELQSIDNSWLDPSTMTSLGAGGGGNGGAGWDQFETNRRLFNVKDTYDENLYTKRLDLNKMTPEQIARAERLAREIESQSTSNIHLLEERGQLDVGTTSEDVDEEARYSGVIREDYVPVSYATAAGHPKGGAPGFGAPAAGAWRKISTASLNNSPTPSPVATATSPVAPTVAHLPENNAWRRGSPLITDPVQQQAPAATANKPKTTAPSTTTLPGQKPSVVLPPIPKQTAATAAVNAAKLPSPTPAQAPKSTEAPAASSSAAGPASTPTKAPAVTAAPAAASTIAAPSTPAPAASETKPATTAPSTPAPTTTTATPAATPAAETKPASSKLNANAKEWVPSFAIPSMPKPAAAAATTTVPPVAAAAASLATPIAVPPILSPVVPVAPPLIPATTPGPTPSTPSGFTVHSPSYAPPTPTNVTMPPHPATPGIPTTPMQMKHQQPSHHNQNHHHQQSHHQSSHHGHHYSHGGDNNSSSGTGSSSSGAPATPSAQSSSAQIAAATAVATMALAQPQVYYPHGMDPSGYHAHTQGGNTLMPPSPGPSNLSPVPQTPPHPGMAGGLQHPNAAGTMSSPPPGPSPQQVMPGHGPHGGHIMSPPPHQGYMPTPPHGHHGGQSTGPSAVQSPAGYASPNPVPGPAAAAANLQQFHQYAAAPTFGAIPPQMMSNPYYMDPAMMNAYYGVPAGAHFPPVAPGQSAPYPPTHAYPTQAVYVPPPQPQMPYVQPTYPMHGAPPSPAGYSQQGHSGAPPQHHNDYHQQGGGGDNRGGYNNDRKPYSGGR